MIRINQLLAATFLSAAMFLASAAQAQNKTPCELLSQAEAQSILGEPVELRAKKDDQCLFVQSGYTPTAPKNHLVEILVWYAASPDPNGYAETYKDIADHSVPSQIVTNVPSFGDAATWVWVPGWEGRFYALKGGIIQVQVIIRGVPEDKALQSAKVLAAKAFGGTGGTGFVYVAPKANIAQVAATAAAEATARAERSAARQALANEPEVRQANGTANNYQATQNLPNGDTRKPSQTGMALNGFLASNQMQASLDRLEVRLDNEARACQFCASKEDELSELIHERVQFQETVAHISTQTGTAGSLLLNLTSAPTRWRDRNIALSEATVYLREHCQRIKAAPDEFCQSSDGDRKLVGAHEKTWAKCFREHNWVDESSQRVAYEACLIASDPFTQLCAAGRKASPPERTCPQFGVGAADVDHLLYYSDRWTTAAHPNNASADFPPAAPQASDVRQRWSRYGQRVTGINLSLTGNVFLDQAQPKPGHTVPADIQQMLSHMKVQLAATQQALSRGDTNQAVKDLEDGEATAATVEKYMHNK